MRILGLAFLALGMVAFVGCEGSEGRAFTSTPAAAPLVTASPRPSATPIEVVSGPPFDRFEVTSAGYEAALGPFATLVDVRLARHEGFDRLVFEVREGALPPYRIAYATPPAKQCASGERIAVGGAALLEVTLRNTYPYDPYTGASALRTAFTPSYPAIVEARVSCAFEAVAAWALGISERLPFRVSTLSGPTRLVIDVRHP